MTHFEDGPAQGKSLMLKRSPIFLRVVYEGTQWDGLDQVEDKPKPSEQVHVYERVSVTGHAHVLARGDKGQRVGGFFPIATYRLCATPPEERFVRSNLAWQAWCRATVASRKETE